MDSPRGVPSGLGHQLAVATSSHIRSSGPFEPEVASLPPRLRLPLPFFGPSPVVADVLYVTPCLYRLHLHLQTRVCTVCICTYNPAFSAVLGGEMCFEN